MPKRKRDDRTADLFEMPEQPDSYAASMDYRREVAHLVSQMLREADGDRYEIAARMSRMTGTEVSKYMLDAWSSESREAYNMPFWVAPVLEAACDCTLFTNWIATRRDGRVLFGREVLNAKRGKLERMKDRLELRINEIRRTMGEAR